MSMQTREQRVARDAILHSILAQMPTVQPGIKTVELCKLAGDKDLKATREWLDRMVYNGVITSKRPPMKTENLHIVTPDWATKHMLMIAAREERYASNGRSAVTRLHAPVSAKAKALIAAAAIANPGFRTVWRGPVPEGYGAAA